MKKIILIVVALAIIQKWDDINLWLSPPPDYTAAHAESVILYATAWCGYCKKTRELLAKHKIPYVEYDIEKSSEGRAQYDRLGGRGIPVLLINGELVKGYNPSKIVELAKR